MELSELNITVTDKPHKHSDRVKFDKINIRVLLLSSSTHPIIGELREELSKLGVKAMVLYLWDMGLVGLMSITLF